MWPVLKPSEDYRLPRDYRNLYKGSPKLEGALPDTEEAGNKITQSSEKY